MKHADTVGPLTLVSLPLPLEEHAGLSRWSEAENERNIKPSCPSHAQPRSAGPQTHYGAGLDHPARSQAADTWEVFIGVTGI